MRVQEIAADFVARCQAGDFDGAGEAHWSADVVSVEAMGGEDSVARGVEAVRAKGQWWYENHEVHGAEAHGPYINGEQFAVRFILDVTPKSSGERVRMDEVGLYTVRDGKIVEERFFYGLM